MQTYIEIIGNWFINLGESDTLHMAMIHLSVDKNHLQSAGSTCSYTYIPKSKQEFCLLYQDTSTYIPKSKQEFWLKE